ncbi:MAG: hypothetical protein EBR81_04620 [Proteobacteria bacterium]|nr:hypothetical protein [Pseudomonadota bacterium]
MLSLPTHKRPGGLDASGAFAFSSILASAGFKRPTECEELVSITTTKKRLLAKSAHRLQSIRSRVPTGYKPTPAESKERHQSFLLASFLENFPLELSWTGGGISLERASNTSLFSA